MKRYCKQAQIVMAIALVTTFLSNTVSTLSAQEEVNIQENDVEKKDEGLEIKSPVKVEESSTIEDEKVTEINNITEEISSLKNSYIENKEENSSVEKADTKIIMNEDFFPDPGFREALKQVMNVKEGEVLRDSAIHNVFWLFLGGTKDNPRTDIKSLEGIQYFYNLAYLDCAYQTELTGTLDLTSNKKMYSLQLIGTKINGLNIDGLDNISIFNVGETNIGGTFDLSNCANLEILNVSDTNINGINIDGLTKLTHFFIFNTDIDGEFDFSNCPSLNVLSLYNTNVSAINIDGLTNLTTFSISRTNIAGEFDLSKNKKLQILNAGQTKVTRLNIDGLTNLIEFDISGNPQLVGSFDFTSNTALNFLNVNNTGTTNVNIQGLRNLTQLGVANTSIPSLDVSTNTSLQVLNASTNLTWLNIGNNPNLARFIKKDSIIDLGQIGDSFNITTVTEAFKGIDISKVTMVSGATYDETTGEVSDYQNGTPIVYSYDSGTMQNGEAVTITVTLNFAKPLMVSEIRINNYAGKKYDGNAVNNPTDITKVGSNGAVTFEWFRKIADGSWESLGEEAPINAGEYGVKAHLAANQNYAAADSGEPFAFTIEKSSSTIKILNDLNKAYDGEVVKEPSVKVEGSSGATTIKWYKKNINGVWELLTTAPKEIGEYKVVVKVAEDENYLSVEAEKEFTIIEKVEVPSTTEEEKVEGVQTGDTTQISMWVMLVGLSMSIMYFFRRKKIK